MQGVGRGIRHEDDYCFIYLIDVRYKREAKNYLPILPKPYYLKRLQTFFKNKSFHIYNS